MSTLKRGKDVLFIHHGFPGQFYHWAVALAAQGNRVVFLSSKQGGKIPGVHTETYYLHGVPKGGHFLLEAYAKNVEAGCAAWRAMTELKAKGFQPNVVIVHADFGSGLFIRQVFPGCKMIAYCEWYETRWNNEFDFDPHDAALLRPGHIMQMHLSNANPLQVMLDADVLITPSEWQRSRFPEDYRKNMLVIPDGVDTEYYRPPLQRQSDIPLITYVSRTMEPFRGFDKFIEALDILMHRHRQCQALLVGQTDRVEYSSALPDGKTYKDDLLERFPLDMTRVAFTGWVSEAKLLQILQASTVHVYLTRPFVLSWSFLQAMSTGCSLVASRTAPVLDAVIQYGQNPPVELVDYFSPQDIARAMENLLQDRTRREHLGRGARKYILDFHNLEPWILEHCRLVEEL